MLPFNHDSEDLNEAVSIKSIIEKANQGKTYDDLTIDELYRLVAYNYLIASKNELVFAPLVYRDDIASRLVEDIERRLRSFVKDMEQDERKVLNFLIDRLEKYLK